MSRIAHSWFSTHWPVAKGLANSSRPLGAFTEEDFFDSAKLWAVENLIFVPL